MVSQPGKSKTRLCLLLGVAIVLFHVTLTTPVLAKAEQHPLDTTHTTPKASKDHSKNSIPNKLPKNKKANKKFAQKSPSKKDTSSLADMVLEATKMDAASLQNSISGLWDNVVQFGKQGAPAFSGRDRPSLEEGAYRFVQNTGGQEFGTTRRTTPETEQ
ncbi:hypothetical protein MVEG_09916 [Podila verticillata NRRL 6337]|nr:hypothetical protein MVEG_09916 [Podila verticillata NRRL 6337]